MIHRAKLRGYVVSCLLCLCTAGAFAQTPEERAGARAAARSGVDKFKAGKYAESLDLFTRAEKLVHAPTHLLYIARANLKLGKLVRAQEAYQQVAREALGADAPKPFLEAQQAAVEELADFESRIPMVTVRVVGPKDTSKVKVTIDDEPVPAALVGIPFPADPGQHRFAAKARGYAGPPVEKTLAESSRTDVELTLTRTGEPLEDPPAVEEKDKATKPSQPDTPRSSSGGGGAGYRIAAYTSLGLGAVGIGMGTYFLLKYNEKQNEADDMQAKCNAKDTGCDEDDKAAIDVVDADAAKRGTNAAIAYVAGGVAVAVGVTLLLVEPKSDGSASSRSGPSLHAYASPSSVGLFGRF